MSSENLEIKIEGDSEGYVTLECPYCESEFKLNAGELQDEDNIIIELNCPYCGLSKEVNDFYTKEVIEQVELIVQNYMYEQLNSMFGNMKKNISKNNFINVDFRPLKKVSLKELQEKDTVETIFKCTNCGNHEKVLYCSGASKVFCAYCGGYI